MSLDFRPKALAALTSGAIALVLVVTYAPAFADHSSVLGIDGCRGSRSARFAPGEVVEVELCMERNGTPLVGVAVAFVEEGPSPTDFKEATTNDEGKARVSLSSPRAGFSRVGACDSQQCWDPVVIAWSEPGRLPPEDIPPRPPSVLPESVSGPFSSAPRFKGVVVPEPTTGFKCADGPASKSLEAPAFITIRTLQTRTATHPATNERTDAFELETGQGFLAGAAAHGEPAVIYVSLAQAGEATDSDGRFPYLGFSRQFVFWARDGARWGKQEFVFRDGVWNEVQPAFVVLARHERLEFFTDDPLRDTVKVAAGSRVGLVCAGKGLPADTTAPPQPSRERPASSGFVPLGIALLALMTALAVAVMQSTEPPPGITAGSPGSPTVRLERSDIKYDDMARPVGYVDILEVADGTTRTIRTKIHQEALLLRDIEFLDAADWEDPSFEISRSQITHDERHLVNGFLEEVKSTSGTVYVSEVSQMRYDGLGRVSGYSRSTRLKGRRGSTEARLEGLTLSYEEAGEPRPRVMLCEKEHIERAEIRFDSEGHVTGYVSVIRTDGSGDVIDDGNGKRLAPAVPRAMFEAGESFGTLPLFESSAITGFQRARRVLIRWFRRHGCKVEIVLLDEARRPVSNAQFRFGNTSARTDHRGRQTMWALEPGNYSLTVGNEDLQEVIAVEGRGEAFAHVLTPRLVGWVSVRHIPGHVKAVYEVTPLTGDAAPVTSEL